MGQSTGHGQPGECSFQGLELDSMVSGHNTSAVGGLATFFECMLMSKH